MSERLNVCKFCGKRFASPKGVYGHSRVHSGSSLFHVCRICGEEFPSSKSLCNHQRIHLGQRNRIVDENENEAAMGLVMLSEQVYEFADVSMGLEVKPVEESVEKKLDSHSGVEKSSTGCDVVAHVVPSTLTSKVQKKPVRYRFKICGKVFGRSNERLDGSIRGELAGKKEDIGGGDSLYGLSEAKKEIASQLPSFQVSQEEEFDTNAKEDFVESSDVEKSSDVVVAQAVPSLLRSKLEGEPESRKRKTFGCYRALNGHQTLHRSTSGQMARKRMILEDGSSLLV